MAEGPKSPTARILDQASRSDTEGRPASPTFLRNRSLTRGMEGGMEGFKLRSKLLKTKLTKPEVETLIEELNKIRIINLEDLASLDTQSILSLNVKPRVRTILWQCAKKHSETFRLKDLFVETNSFLTPGATPQSVNDACDRVASCMHQELGLKRWKDFSHVSAEDLSQLPDISAEEAIHVEELVKFSRAASWGSLQYQFDQVQQSMEIALKNYTEMLKNLSRFQNFVTVGVPLDASLNELLNLKTKLFDQRDQFMRDLSGTQSAGESIEEDPTTHAARPKSLVLTNGAPWKPETNVESTSFRQQLRTLQVNASTTRLFRKSFVDPNLEFISFVGEKKLAPSSNTGSNSLSSGSNSVGFSGGAMEYEDPDAMERVVLTFEKKKNSPIGESSLMLMQTATGDELMRLSAVGKAKEMMEVLHTTPVLSDFDLSRIKDGSGEFKKSLLALENKLTVTNFKFGVLCVKAGQTKEDEFFSNSKGSRAYEEFLKTLGDRVTLKGWKNFTAGLDTRDNRNGAHSIFTTIEGFSAMFHVATMMPYENDNEDQKLERKRHIGNDVVCIVFVEEGATFNPTSVRTEFIHVYVIVTPYTFNNRPYYRIEIATKDGVSKFGPAMPNCLFPNTKSFRQFLLAKLINADIAASNAPAFKKRIMRTRGALLGDILAEAKQNKWLRKVGSREGPPLERDTSSKSLKSSSLGSGFRSIRAKGPVKIEEDEIRVVEKKPSLSIPTASSSHGVKDKDKEKDKIKDKDKDRDSDKSPRS